FGGRSCSAHTAFPLLYSLASQTKEWIHTGVCRQHRASIQGGLMQVSGRRSWFVAALLMALGSLSSVTQVQSGQGTEAKSTGCSNDDSRLKLPPGFCATVFADDIGHARQMVVSPAGVVYVNTWSGVYYGNKPPHEGGFLVALQDKTGAGKAGI